MNGVWLCLCLIAGAVAVGWPDGRRRLVRRTAIAGSAAEWGRSVMARARRRPRRALVGAIGLAAGLALVAGGAVAAVVVAVYAGLGGRALIRRAGRRREVATRSGALDGLVALAADLRAGLVAAGSGSAGSGSVGSGSGSAGSGSAGSGPGDVGGRLGLLTAAAWRLAEQTGAPVADLVERIEADARAADRAAASAAAQAAGAQATALLLAGLPLGGIALGVAIGADPVHVLLHTPAGAVCAIAAVLLQGGGLLWADRLAAGVAR